MILKTGRNESKEKWGKKWLRLKEKKMTGNRFSLNHCPIPQRGKQPVCGIFLVVTQQWHD
jgi:hypothetical protein